MKLISGNRITLLETGDQYFPSLEDALAGAQREVHLETYIFADDAVGQRIAHALALAARRGVIVRLLVDGYGSKNLAPGLRAILEPAGVTILVYRSETKRSVGFLHHLYRQHRKLVVIDGRLAFCGGINVIADRAAGATEPRYDFAVRVEGPIVADIHRAARRLWLLASLRVLAHGARPRMARAARPEPFPDGCLAALITRDNWRHRRSIEEAYLAALDAARSEIVIACAYFLPGRRMRRALRNAAQRGVSVRLLLQGRPDHLLLHYATQALYGALIAAGVELYEYSSAHLHAKVAVVDRGWATVGSSNIDPFSLWLSREANIVFRDRHLAGRLAESLDQAIARRAQAITREVLSGRPWYERIRASALYQLTRLLIGLMGMAARDEL